jgi:aminopeptidase N
MSDPRTIKLEDYAVPPFLVDHIDLRVEIGEPDTEVKAVLGIRRNPDSTESGAPLTLHGVDLKLVSLSIDGTPLGEGTFSHQDEELTVEAMPDACTMEIVTRIQPSANTSLEGLYRADSAYCTQCEAEGFRKITFFPDRPDVMAVFSTTIVADRAACPVLLSNGNPVARGELDDGRHWMTWEDPFPKPSYLFALVAGDLACEEDTFTTASGREVTLRIYVERHNLDKCEHAMRALKKSMAWDEERYGLEYDLDLYMIVAVDDFNMGAMENKGLNIFNSRYVLARPDTATDADFAGIEAVIAHEYFHNWTGNRVTCRDWFQLSLKEGLTVFRDQQFSADQGSPAVKRIQDVRILRTAQFAEDAGPMAHPIRPDAYIEINNFYTVTIYNKGAEVIRMIHTLLGEERFRAGMDLYFQRHDGQAVTTNDFIAAMSDASGVSLAQFERWYSQAGTPELDIKSSYDAQQQTVSISVRQSIPATPGQTEKLPMHLPIAMGLLNENGGEVTPHNVDANDGTFVLELTEGEQHFSLSGVASEPTLSVLRNFSAPVKIRQVKTTNELAFLFGHDTDPFNRWDAGQTLLMDAILTNVQRFLQNNPMSLETDLIDAVRATLISTELDPAFIAEAVSLPAISYIAEQMEVVELDAIDASKRFVRETLSRAMVDELADIHDRLTVDVPYRFDQESTGRRALRNAALDMLMAVDGNASRQRALAQFNATDNMTDSMAALRALSNVDCDERLEVLKRFEERWRDDTLVMDKWLSVQAMSVLPGALREVEALLAHPSFDLKKPNKVRALVGAFCHGNLPGFHHASGAGYDFLADQVAELDKLNPQITARLLGAFGRWKRFPPNRRDRMEQALQHIAGIAGLSRDSYEVVKKTLG